MKDADRRHSDHYSDSAVALTTQSDLIRLIREFIDEEVRSLSTEDQTERDDLLVEASEHFIGLLLRHAKSKGGVRRMTGYESGMKDLLHQHRKLMRDSEALSMADGGEE